MNLKFSDRTLGLLAFTPPLFSDRVTVRIDIGPCTGHWSRSLRAVNVGFARVSRSRYLFSRSSVDVQMQFRQPNNVEEFVRELTGSP